MIYFHYYCIKLYYSVCKNISSVYGGTSSSRRNKAMDLYGRAMYVTFL